MSSPAVRIAARLRPPLPGEVVDTDGLRVISHLSSNKENSENDSGPGPGIILTTTKDDRVTQQHYPFHSTYDSSHSTHALYNHDVLPLVDRVLEGATVTVFAYGVTSSGKTFTMQGNGKGTGGDSGIIGSVVDELFTRIHGTNATISMSYLELYLDSPYDLLVPSSRRQKLQILSTSSAGTTSSHTGPPPLSFGTSIHLPYLSTHPVDSPAAFRSLYADAARQRSTGATLLNSNSSRSHAVLTLYVSLNGLVGKLHLLDLAGSENNNLTGNNPERMKESSAINKSLTALGQVVNALNDNVKIAARASARGEEPTFKLIPYRSSALTRLLSDALGGSSLALLIICLAPGTKFRKDVGRSVAFASQARRIENKIPPRQDIPAKVPSSKTFDFSVPFRSAPTNATTPYNPDPPSSTMFFPSPHKVSLIPRSGSTSPARRQRHRSRDEPEEGDDDRSSPPPPRKRARRSSLIPVPAPGPPGRRMSFGPEGPSQRPRRRTDRLSMAPTAEEDLSVSAGLVSMIHMTEEEIQERISKTVEVEVEKKLAAQLLKLREQGLLVLKEEAEPEEEEFQSETVEEDSVKIEEEDMKPEVKQEEMVDLMRDVDMEEVLGVLDDSTELTMIEEVDEEVKKEVKEEAVVVVSSSSASTSSSASSPSPFSSSLTSPSISSMHPSGSDAIVVAQKEVEIEIKREIKEELRDQYDLEYVMPGAFPEPEIGHQVVQQEHHFETSIADETKEEGMADKKEEVDTDISTFYLDGSWLDTQIQHQVQNRRLSIDPEVRTEAEEIVKREEVEENVKTEEPKEEVTEETFLVQPETGEVDDDQRTTQHGQTEVPEVQEDEDEQVDQLIDDNENVRSAELSATSSLSPQSPPTDPCSSSVEPALNNSVPTTPHPIPSSTNLPVTLNTPSPGIGSSSVPNAKPDFPTSSAILSPAPMLASGSKRPNRSKGGSSKSSRSVTVSPLQDSVSSKAGSRGKRSPSMPFSAAEASDTQLARAWLSEGFRAQQARNLPRALHCYQRAASFVPNNAKVKEMIADIEHTIENDIAASPVTNRNSSKSSNTKMLMLKGKGAIAEATSNWSMTPSASSPGQSTQSSGFTVPTPTSSRSSKKRKFNSVDGSEGEGEGEGSLESPKRVTRAKAKKNVKGKGKARAVSVSVSEIGIEGNSVESQPPQEAEIQHDWEVPPSEYVNLDRRLPDSNGASGSGSSSSSPSSGSNIKKVPAALSTSPPPSPTYSVIKDDAVQPPSSDIINTATSPVVSSPQLPSPTEAVSVKAGMVDSSPSGVIIEAESAPLHASNVHDNGPDDQMEVDEVAGALEDERDFDRGSSLEPSFGTDSHAKQTTPNSTRAHTRSQSKLEKLAQIKEEEEDDVIYDSPLVDNDDGNEWEESPKKTTRKKKASSSRKPSKKTSKTTSKSKSKKAKANSKTLDSMYEESESTLASPILDQENVNPSPSKTTKRMRYVYGSSDDEEEVFVRDVAAPTKKKRLNAATTRRKVLS